MADLTHEEADRRVKAAMAPPVNKQAGRGFSQGIQTLRNTAKKQSNASPNKQITTAG